MHSGLINSKEKLLLVSMFSRITFILGWFWYFSMACLIVTASLSEEVLVRPSIPRFSFIFISYDTDIRQSVVYPCLILYWYMWKCRLSLSHTILTYVKATFISISYNTDICQSVVYPCLILYWYMRKCRLSLSHTILTYVKASFVSISYDTDICQSVV